MFENPIVKKLIGTLKKYIRNHVLSPQVKETAVVQAYDIWADNYDAQPDNLMLHLDNILFGGLLEGLELKNKEVADIGCGTGRHWPGILERGPINLTGFDVSPGMLQKLKEKFPAANVQVIADDRFSIIQDGCFDVIISTLTVAHIENITEALTAWVRILKSRGDLIITDFHPNALASGGQRTFKHAGKHIAVKNYVHTTGTIKQLLLKAGFQLIAEREIKVDETLKHYYEAQKALHVYERFKGSPIIYGLHFRRG